MKHYDGEMIMVVLKHWWWWIFYWCIKNDEEHTHFDICKSFAFFVTIIQWIKFTQKDERERKGNVLR